MKKIFLAFFTVFCLAAPSWAAPLPGADSDLPVDITADSMEYDSDKNIVMFRGQVEAIRGEFKMWSDILTLILKDKSGQEEKTTDMGKNAAGDIDRVIAEKNVRFRNGTLNPSAHD